MSFNVGVGVFKTVQEKIRFIQTRWSLFLRASLTSYRGCLQERDWASQGSKFDREIRGWCKYWNDVLGAQDPIDPDLVKALIATESGFRASVKIKDGRGQGHATGLMQITDATRLILSDEDGELKDHLVNVNESELKNPTFNIAAGIRWLFHKKSLASKRLGHEASWQETIMVYKGYKRLDHPQMLKFMQILQELRK
jgi:hypothetical protein